MLILPQFVTLTWNGTTKKYYEPKGYKYTKKGEGFLINVLDLSESSNAKVKIICDYCNVLFEKVYNDYNKWKKRNIIKKDCCKQCVGIKNKESVKKKYGVGSAFDLPHVKAKRDEYIDSKKIPPQQVQKEFQDKGYTMIGEYVDNQTPIEYICSKHGMKTITRASLYMGKGCKECGYESISGENHYCWKGGTKALREHLHNNVIKVWKVDSAKIHNYKCVITGDVYSDIHHLYNFQNILSETLESLHLEFKGEIGSYTTEELNRIEELCLELHYKYGFGVSLRKDVHNLFHHVYGRKDNTPEQFDEFKQRYLNKEFDHLLEYKEMVF